MAGDAARRRIRVGLIGAGFIGRTHALAIRAVSGVFATGPEAVPHVLADVDLEKAGAIATATGFAHVTGDWREAVDRSDAVVIAVPSSHHAEIARHAISAGKPVLCEKPVGLSAAEAADIAEAAAAAGLVNAVGYTYLRAPLVRHAKRLLDSGRLGRVTHFHGRHFEDYLASPDAPFSWRLDRRLAGRCGALGDLGCHILSIARFLCGPVHAVSGTSSIVHPRRRTADGSLRDVENEDHAAALVRFEGGVPGSIEVSRVATGRKMDIAFELTCEKGTIRFDGERAGELQVFETEADGADAGFRRVLIGPDHPGYAEFLPAPGHGLGFNDLKTIELALFLRAIHTGETVYPDLREAARIGYLCEAILDSAASGQWIHDPEQPPARRLALERRQP
jgi:predicted dehydrogenase